MAQDTPSPPRAPRRRKLAAAVLLLLLGSATVAGWMVLASGRPPAELTEIRQKIQAIPPASRAERALAFEQTLASVVTQPFPGESSAFASSITTGSGGVSRIEQMDGSVRIGLDVVDLNLWFEERLSAWLEHQGQALPEGVQGWLTVKDGRLHLIAAHERRLEGRPITVMLLPQMAEATGTLRFDIQGVRIGRVPLPVATVKDRVQGLHAMLDQLMGEPGLDPVWPIDDRRARRMTAIETTPTQLWFTLTAEAIGG